ncbi:MAG TPA: serine/threonine-protein kinase [Bryobacteraceae bacterium]|nr:serine/threonine-protein kinase [Bryobacteraceae bacterium]
MNSRLEDLFHELADLPPAAREQYFARHGVDQQTRREVEKLLAFDPSASGLLQRDIELAAQRTLGHLEKAGQRCGPYVLVRLIGRGGMGAVYLAQRADGEVTQQVAVKLLRPGADYLERERFLQERQILATLAHPNVARLLDAGHLEDGQPFLAMEYVDGRPIDAFTNELPVRKTIALFVQVCTAVAYLHRNLIVHRDLKPTNILVSEDGEPKLLDFGIAKLIYLRTDSTSTGLRMLTPEYASPEQITGGAVSTATDIYSLGAVLYRLLTRKPRYEVDHGSPEAILAAICTREATRPSKWMPSLKGDLEIILMKALRKDPQERYATAEQFAEDLESFLASRPIRARKGDLAYRARKFIRRFWLPLAAAAIVITSLLAGVYIANRERAIAEQRFLLVRELANKLFDIDAQIRNTPGNTKARELIVSTSLEYLKRVGAETRGDKGLAMEIGSAYLQLAQIQGVPVNSNLGQFAEAEESLKKADAFVESVLKVDSKYPRALLTSATVAHDRMALASMQNRPDESLVEARKAAEQLDRYTADGGLGAWEIREAAFMYGNIAVAFDENHRYADTIRYARRAVEISQSLASAAPQRSLALGIMAVALRDSGDLEGALESIQESRKIQEQLLADKEKTWQRANLALALWREGSILGDPGEVNLNRSAEAAQPIRRAFDIAREMVDNDPDDNHGRIFFAEVGRQLGTILAERSPQEAMGAYDRSIETIHKARNSNDESKREDAMLLADSSYSLRRLHRENEARQGIERAFSLLRETKDYPADKITLGGESDIVMRASADQYAETGQLEKAAQVYRELLAKVMASNPDPWNDLEDAYHLSGHYAAVSAILGRVGLADEAASIERRRRELWKHWNQKLPNNQFVLRQIAAPRVK